MISRQERGYTQPHAGGRSGTVVGEFVDAARSAAESLLEEQKRQIADRVAGLAASLRGAVRPLEESQNRILGRYLEQAAVQVESFARLVRERGWHELVADTEEFARRQPTLFVFSAVATGFVAGRLFWASTGRHKPDAARSAQSSEPAPSVTAAVSSGTGAGALAGNSTSPTGAVEAR
jgi:ElaB/YqjD/DUF883 family membrane-anchored ribosome-binding protein